MAIVERATDQDWRDLRAVRLSALAESPTAFGSTLDAEEALDDSAWRSWVRNGAVFIATASGAPVGMVAVVDGDAADERSLVALWVAPEHRGSGVGSALVSHVEDWARRDGARQLTLWVAHGNEEARRLYRRHGFRDTGRHRPLPSNPDVDEEHMHLALV